MAAPSRQSEPDVAERKNLLYADAVRRHGGSPIVLDAGASKRVRRDAMNSMQGLLLTGGADIDPARYGRPTEGARATEGPDLFDRMARAD